MTLSTNRKTRFVVKTTPDDAVLAPNGADAMGRADTRARRRLPAALGASPWPEGCSSAAPLATTGFCGELHQVACLDIVAQCACEPTHRFERYLCLAFRHVR